MKCSLGTVLKTYLWHLAGCCWKQGPGSHWRDWSTAADGRNFHLWKALSLLPPLPLQPKMPSEMLLLGSPWNSMRKKSNGRRESVKIVLSSVHRNPPEDPTQKAGSNRTLVWFSMANSYVHAFGKVAWKVLCIQEALQCLCVLPCHRKVCPPQTFPFNSEDTGQLHGSAEGAGLKSAVCYSWFWKRL